MLEVCIVYTHIRTFQTPNSPSTDRLFSSVVVRISCPITLYSRPFMTGNQGNTSLSGARCKPEIFCFFLQDGIPIAPGLF